MVAEFSYLGLTKNPAKTLVKMTYHFLSKFSDRHLAKFIFHQILKFTDFSKKSGKV